MLINNFISKNKIFYFAHRGAPLLKHENTIESFERAIQLGCDGIEMDIQLTKDSKIIIFHDDYILYKDTKHYISKLSYFEIKQLCKYKQITMPPLLEEAIPIIINNPNIIFNLEIKSTYLNNYYILKTIKATIPLKLLTKQCIVSSFNYFLLLQLNFFLKGIFVGFILKSNQPTNWQKLFIYKKMIKLLKPTFLHLSDQFINLDLVKWAQNNKIIVNVYTINDHKRLDKMLRIGINGIFTDNHKFYENN